jgi:quercetin dioxygenase-like cupin family protein
MKVINFGIFILASNILFSGVPNLYGQDFPLSAEAIDLKSYPVEFDRDLGAFTARIGEGRLYQIDATLVEIPPGGQLAPHRHLAEEIIYVVSGNGYTSMWNRMVKSKERYNLTEGDLLSPSMNTWHQHFNSSSDMPFRFLSITTTPLTRNLFRNPAFISSSDFIFEDRWKQGITQQPEYNPEGGFEGPEVVRMRVGHHLPDLPGREMRQRDKDVLGITILPEGDLAGNHLLEMEVREYQSKDMSLPSGGHRHAWEVVYVVLDGEGSTIAKQGDNPARVVNWQKGELYLVQANEYHDNGARIGSPLRQPYPRVLQVKASGYFRDVGNIGGIDRSPMIQ